MADPAPPLLASQRISATGSRHIRRLLLAGDYTRIVGVARSQLDAGARALDVSVAIPGLGGERERMCLVLDRLRSAVSVPLLVDSVDPDVQLAGLECLGGRAIVNSVNLSGGTEALDRLIPVARAVRAAVVVQTIDERGMARTAARKARVAAAAVALLGERYGLTPASIIVDPLLFPAATLAQSGAARETLEGIRRIKSDCPSVRTILGLGNGSFGMPPQARPCFDSVLLHHAAQAGLDLAIADPACIRPYADLPQRARALAEDLIFGRHPDALTRYLEQIAISSALVHRGEATDRG